MAGTLAGVINAGIREGTSFPVGVPCAPVDELKRQPLGIWSTSLLAAKGERP